MIYFTYSLGALGLYLLLFPLPPRCLLRVPLVTARFRAQLEAAGEAGAVSTWRLAAWRATARLLQWAVPAPAMWARLRAVHGVPVAVSVLNSEEDWEEAVSLGVDAIETDYPARLSAYLARVRQARQQDN